MKLHATRKLFARLPLDDKGRLPVTSHNQWLYERPVLETNPLGGWHGNLVTLQRRNCVLLVHDQTRFPVVMPALTNPDFAELNYRFVDVLMNTLLKSGAEQEHLDIADRYLRPLQMDTECNRSVQGTLNRMKGDVEHMLWYDQVNIADLTGYRLGAWLADSPCTAKGLGVLFPRRNMLALLSRLARSSDPEGPRDEPVELPDNVVDMDSFRTRTRE